MPTGHLFVDHVERDGRIRVVLQQAPISDLMITMKAGDLEHRGQTPIDREYEGLIALAMSPSVIGRYEIDIETGEVIEGDLAVDEERVWGGILPAVDSYSPAARARLGQLWYGGAGYDPDLVPEAWWRLYGDATDGLVSPADLPDHALPGTLSRVDLDSMKVAEVYAYQDGAFPSPPTFVPRVGAEDPDDGYVLVVVHQDGDKELQLFDAQHIEAGPLARATAPGFNPNLMLHSTWMADRVGPRPSTYRVGRWRDLAGGLKGMPGTIAGFFTMGWAVSRAQRAAR
jgi:hypothetical protein